MALILVGEASVAEVGLEQGQSAKPAMRDLPLYASVQDPPGQQPTRILSENGVLHFGQSAADRDSLLRSDLGGPMYFVRVDGGVRVRGEPIIFPDGSRSQFRFEDYDCSAFGSSETQDVVCRNKSSGQLYHSTVAGGGLLRFDFRCFDQSERVCHYRLIEGQAIRPSNIQED